MKKRYLHVVLITLLCFFAYYNIFYNEFVFDDLVLLVGNMEIRSLSNIPEFFAEQSHAGLYRPFRSVIYSLVFHFSGTRPFGYHLNSLLMHIVNTILVYCIVNALVKNRNVSLIAALIFAVHPIHTDRVTNMTAGFDLYGTAFYLLSFYLYILYSKKREIGYLIGSLSIFVLGLFTSEELLTLPAVIVLYDFCYGKIKEKKILKNYIPFVILTAMFLLIRLQVLGKFGRTEHYYAGTLYHNILTTFPIIWKYIMLLFVPVNLMVEYDNIVYIGWVGVVVVSFIGLLLLTALIIASYKWSKIVFFSGAFFFITLSPFLNLVPLFTLMEERYLYLASISFCILIALLLNKILNLKFSGIDAKITRTVGILLIVLILFSFTYIAVKRNSEWRDGITLWSRNIETAPFSTRAHDNLGFSYLQIQRYEDAITHFNIAIRLNPRNFYAYTNLGIAYAQQEDYQKAITFLNKAIEINPKHYRAHNNLGLAYARIKEYNLSIESQLEAIELHPEYSKAHSDLGVVYAEIGDYESAVKELKTAIELYPEYGDAHYNLGIVYARMGREDLAQQEFTIADKLGETKYIG